MRQLHGFLYVLALCGIVFAADFSNATGDSITLFPTNHFLEYRPAYDCVDFRFRHCYGWKYAWESAVYEDKRTGVNRSVAFITNEVGDNIGNGVREISLAIPRGVYPARVTGGHDCPNNVYSARSTYLWGPTRLEVQLRDGFARAMH